MSISLNNHESRITKLEQAQNDNSETNEYIKIGKYILQWGNIGDIYSYSWVTKTFPKPFPNACVCIVDGSDGLHFDSVSKIRIIDKTSFKVATNNSNGIAQWNYLAIGYLISDRILKYAYACKSLLFTPLRKLEV